MNANECALLCPPVWVAVFQGKCHVEMSYFEVYNEKIHDLLVTRDEPNQRKMPVSTLQFIEYNVFFNYLNQFKKNVFYLF